MSAYGKHHLNREDSRIILITDIPRATADGSGQDVDREVETLPALLVGTYNGKTRIFEETAVISVGQDGVANILVREHARDGAFHAAPVWRTYAAPFLRLSHVVRERENL